MDSYLEFLCGKKRSVRLSGFDVRPEDINPMLFDWQRDIVRWALRLGKAGLFEAPGLGKTPQQLEWARHVVQHTGRKVLVLAPLAVAHQTVQEGAKFGIPVTYCRSQEQAEAATERIIIANYEMLKAFDASCFGGVVLDESGILKAFTGKTKRFIIETFRNTPYKLACTATPAPNDHLELGNHAEFLDVMPSNEMIARWFINDSMRAGNYRLKHHAEADFWRWLTSWAVCLSLPSDLGNYSDDGFVLPPLRIHEHFVPVDHARAHVDGRLFLNAKLSATDMWREKRETKAARAAKAREIVDAAPGDFWIIWCDTNYEADALKAQFPEAVEVRGSHSIKVKEKRLRGFSEGRHRIIITKPGIAGFGLNWQHCRNQVFVGVSYSFERFIQALSRSWRFMVAGEVNVHLVSADSESNILDVLWDKRAAFEVMQKSMNEAMSEHGLFRDDDRRLLRLDADESVASGEGWKLYLGDCVARMREIETESVDFTIYSPPFSTLYIYSDLISDMGNNVSDAEFFAHYDYLVPELYRVSAPGARCAVHCKDLPLYKNRDGAAGLSDFPSRLIQSHENAGFVLERWITVWKDPVIEMERTKNHGLLWRNFSVRGEVCRQGMADYVLVFRKIDRENLAVEEAAFGTASASIVSRCLDLWTNSGEAVIVPEGTDTDRCKVGLDTNGKVVFSLFDEPLDRYDDWFVFELHRKTLPGRLAVVRCKDAVLLDGSVQIGLRNMAGEVIRRFSSHGWTFHSRCFVTDGYSLVAFRKWTDDMPDKQVQNAPLPPASGGDGHFNYIGAAPPQNWVTAGGRDPDRYYSIKVWQKYASPVWFDLPGTSADHSDVWFDINQTDTLNFRLARDGKDEKHIAPLQMGIIRRGVQLWSELGDLVLSPFAGVGSEGVGAIGEGRQFVGIELKQGYFDWAVKFLQEAERKTQQVDLFAWANLEVG